MTQAASVRMHHVALHVPNLERTSRFYQAAFGFEPLGPIQQWSADPELDEAIDVSGSAAQVQMLHAGDFHLELFEYSKPDDRLSRALRPHDHGYTHFGVQVENLDEAMNHLAALGMDFGGRRPLDKDGVRAIYGKDPDGNIVELLEFAGDLTIMSSS